MVTSAKKLVTRGVGAITRRLFGLEFDDVAALGCSVVRRVETNEALVGLSFDDGPSDYGTPAILDILSEFECRATFFVIGKNVLRHRRLARRILDEGHEIGSHGHSHLDFHWSSPLAARRDVRLAQDAIRTVTAAEARLLRAPFGHFRIDLAWWSRRVGLTHLVGWDISPRWNETVGERIATYVLERIRCGSIVALHDAFDVQPSDSNGYVAATSKGLPRILEGIRERGLAPVTVSRLLECSATRG